MNRPLGNLKLLFQIFFNSKLIHEEKTAQQTIEKPEIYYGDWENADTDASPAKDWVYRRRLEETRKGMKSESFQD